MSKVGELIQFLPASKSIDEYTEEGLVRNGAYYAIVRYLYSSFQAEQGQERLWTSLKD